MPVVIEQLTSQFEIRDEVKIRKLVRQEIKAALADERRRSPAGGAAGADPADPAAGGRPGEDG